MNTFNLNVTVSFSPDTLTTLNGLLVAINNGGQTVTGPVKSNGSVAQDSKVAAAIKKANSTPNEKSNGQAAVAEIKVTLEQLREGFAKHKTSKEGKLKCKEILDNLGATSVSSIPEDRYAEALTALNNI